MERSDFYYERKGERRIDFLQDYSVVRQYICRKYDLPRADFEFLCKLHGLKRFVRHQFIKGEELYSWDRERWKRFYGPLVEVFRERAPKKGQNYKIYKLTHRANTLMEEAYAILCGKKGIPEGVRANPMMKESTYNDKRYAAAVKAFNAARNLRQE